ncbi:DUF721 domain-containing protein [Pararhodobacter sp.]|uniref:DUF721 domain-containing protein n=1 Tax=Pararhodobacter sp. TaxID=2127056 RepID=UPI002AFF3CFF|nr:DciA family protein [Pararhodobacter sp.]
MSKPADRSGPRGPRRMRGFEAAAGLLRDPIRKAGETRGFAVTRLLTHWPEVAGPDLAPLCRPVNVSYAKQGLGATLTLLTSGAAAPLVQMQADKLRERVNAIYGYAAIARIRVTQTSARGTMAGLAEAQRPFDGPNITRPSAQALARAQGVLDGLTEGVADSGLKSALERLATQVLLRQDRLGAKGPAGDRKEDP